MIKNLFFELENKTKDEKSIRLFDESGMINKYQKLGFGFFPLGHGILSNNFEAEKTELSECKIMVLGNDFGTLDYLTNKCKNNRESSTNPTISNLLNELNLNTADTFFTNFYLGVRKEGTNTKRIVALTSDYKKLCFEFFVKQIETIDPEFVICLGHEVRQALAEQSDLFASWKGKSKTLKGLYSKKQHEINIADKELGNRKFIVIPHPCDTRNFTKEYVNEILMLIQN